MSIKSIGIARGKALVFIYKSHVIFYFNYLLINWQAYNATTMKYFYIITYSTAQQPLKSFERPLMRGSLSNSILVTLIIY